MDWDGDPVMQKRNKNSCGVWKLVRHRLCCWWLAVYAEFDGRGRPKEVLFFVYRAVEQQERHPPGP